MPADWCDGRSSSDARRLRLDGPSGHLRIIKRIAALEHVIDIEFKYEKPLNEHNPGQHGPLMFGADPLHAHRVSAAFSLAATSLFFGFIGIEFGLISPDFLGNLTYRCSASSLTTSAGDPVLHVHGRHSRALRPCRGSARFD
jgi:hypothetical protein